MGLLKLCSPDLYMCSYPKHPQFSGRVEKCAMPFYNEQRQLFMRSLPQLESKQKLKIRGKVGRGRRCVQYLLQELVEHPFSVDTIRGITLSDFAS